MNKLPEFLSRCAEVFGSLRHTPNAEDTRVSYRSLMRALDLQFDILRAFVNVEFSTVDPYGNSALMFADIASAHRLTVYTYADLPADHPLNLIHNCGQTYNSVFRAVHDGLAHFPERLTFGPIGEFRAFQAHAKLIGPSSPALRALATETLGQNAWYNFGPRTHESPRPFAPQIAAAFPSGTLDAALRFPL